MNIILGRRSLYIALPEDAIYSSGDVLYLVTILIGCWLVPAIRCYARFASTGFCRLFLSCNQRVAKTDALIFARISTEVRRATYQCITHTLRDSA